MRSSNEPYHNSSIRSGSCGRETVWHTQVAELRLNVEVAVIDPAAVILQDELAAAQDCQGIRLPHNPATLIVGGDSLIHFLQGV